MVARVDRVRDFFQQKIYWGCGTAEVSSHLGKVCSCTRKLTVTGLPFIGIVQLFDWVGPGAAVACRAAGLVVDRLTGERKRA